jgi:hypothetical protein
MAATMISKVRLVMRSGAFLQLRSTSEPSLSFDQAGKPNAMVWTPHPDDDLLYIDWSEVAGVAVAAGHSTDDVEIDNTDAARDAVRALPAGAPVSSNHLIEAHGIKRNEASELIRELVDEGVLRRQGTRAFRTDEHER